MLLELAALLKRKKKKKKKETANEGCTALGSHFKSKTFGLHMSLGVGYSASDQCISCLLYTSDAADER